MPPLVQKGVKPTEISCALVQQPPVYLNLPESTALAETLIGQAADWDADLIVFPETWLPGYPVWLDGSPSSARWGYPPADRLNGHYLKHSPVWSGPEFDALASTCSKRKIDAVIGFSERSGNTLYNSTALLGSDGFRARRRKLMPTYNEKLLWGLGDGSTLNVWPRAYGRVGSLICWEHWMPLARAAIHDGHENLHIAQWPAAGDLHQLASRHYAFEGQCAVIVSACVLTKEDVLDGYDSARGPESARALLASLEDGFLKNGGSAIVRADTSYVLEPVFESRDLMTATFDPREGVRAHLLDTSGHYARPDVLQLVVDTAPKSTVRRIALMDDDR